MLEIITLIVLAGRIGDMARRRGRSASLFVLLLLVCWFGGEIAGAGLGYLLSATAEGAKPNLLLAYGLALTGAAVGAGTAFLAARAFEPVDGVWREPSELPVRRSRLWGAVAGGVGGGVIGAIVVAVMYGGEGVESSLLLAARGFLTVGVIGALLGMISGVQEE